MKLYYQTHRPEYAEYRRKWREKNPDKVKRSNHEQYLKRKSRKEAKQHESK